MGSLFLCLSRDVKEINWKEGRKKVKFKPTFYYFLIMLFFKNIEAKYTDTHIFSLMIIITSILIILMNRVRVSEEDDFKFRHVIIGFVSAQGLYYLEEIIMN